MFNYMCILWILIFQCLCICVCAMLCVHWSYVWNVFPRQLGLLRSSAAGAALVASIRKHITTNGILRGRQWRPVTYWYLLLVRRKPIISSAASASATNFHVPYYLYHLQSKNCKLVSETCHYWWAKRMNLWAMTSTAGFQSHTRRVSLTCRTVTALSSLLAC